MKGNRNLNNVLKAATLFLGLCLAAFFPAGAYGENSYSLANGIKARVYGPDEILAMAEKDSDGRMLLVLPNGTSYRLIEDIADPEIANKGDGSFHPMNAEWVLAALTDIRIGDAVADLEVRIYILPYPRSGFLSSSACGSDVFLSPGVIETPRSRVAWTVTHEVGHVFQRRYAPEGGESWLRYVEMRGIDGPAYQASAAHAYRPVEILAEDFRYLFGGPYSEVAGGIENEELALPDRVPGLEAYLVSLVSGEVYVSVEVPAPLVSRIVNYPNPFNPSTTISLEIDATTRAGEEVSVDIFSVDGALVRELHRGAIPDGALTVRWDGRDGSGRAVASGVYLCRVRAGVSSFSRKMILAR